MMHESELPGMAEAHREPRNVQHREEVNDIAVERLKDILEQLEGLDDNRIDIVGQMKACFTSAKEEGFDTKTIRRIMTLRRLPAHQRIEQDALLKLYRNAVGLTD